MIILFFSSNKLVLISTSFLLVSTGVILTATGNCLPAQAGGIELYISCYLRIREPIALELDDMSNTRDFSPLELSDRKRYFEDSCINCHVGGSTLRNPKQSLALDTLKGANPSRDNINALIFYMGQPMTYDVSGKTFWCREITPNILSQPQIENFAAFVLASAKKAPGSLKPHFIKIASFIYKNYYL